MQLEILVLQGLTLGERVKIERILRGWRQLDVAVVAGVSPNYVSALERDAPCYPSARKRILEALDLQDPDAEDVS